MINQALLSDTEIRRLINQGRQLPLASHSADNTQTGEQSTEGLGHGMDFADMRPYQPGDNPRRIDWRASARRQQTLIRLYHADTSTPCCILVDRQASMRFGSRVRSKSAQAARIAIILASANMQGGNPLSALILGKKTHWIKPSSEKNVFQRLTQAISKASPPLDEIDENNIDWQTVSSQILHRLSTNSSLYIISDFLSLDPGCTRSLQQLGKYYRCHALQIIDPVESTLTQRAGLQLCWGDKQLDLDNGSQQIMQQQVWQQQLESLFQGSGITHQTISSDLEELTPHLQVRPR